MAETNLGRVAIVPKGTYSASVQYYYLDLVSSDGNTYVAISDPPMGISPTNATYWQLIATGGSPKGVYANLAALQAAFPTGTTGIYVTSDNGHWYFWSGSAWSDGGVYQGPINNVVQTTGTSEIDVMSQKAVTDEVDKLTIAFQKLNLVISKYAVQTQTWYGEDYNHLVIPVNGGETLVYTTTDPYGTAYGAFLTDYIKPVAGETPSYVSGYANRQLFSGGVIQIPNGCKYLIINNPFINGSTITSLLINEVEIINGVFAALFDFIAKIVTSISSESTDTHFPSAKCVYDAIEVAKGLCVKDSDLTIERTSNNIINPSWIKKGSVNSDGTIYIGEDSTWSVVEIPVLEGQVISIGGFKLGRIGFYAYYNNTTLVSYNSFFDPDGAEMAESPFTVPSGVNKLYIDIATNLSPSNPYDLLMANYGSDLKSYDDYKTEITKINGYDIAGSGGINTIVTDLPVAASGSGISSGYAYIDSADGYTIKVKQ